MGKTKKSLPPVSEIIKGLKQNKILPVYLICGEDSFSIDEAVAAIESKAGSLISSEFDRETFHGDTHSLNSVIDFASAFPFGEGKKLILYRDFDKVKDKSALKSYIASPSEFTILVILFNSKIANPASEPYASLNAKGFLFEAKELRGHYLIDWIVNRAAAQGKIISKANAQIMVDIVGENRAFIEDQLDKLIIYSGEKDEIAFESIKALSVKLKKYTIFDLQNSIGRKDKKSALKVAYGMLEQGEEPLMILAILTKYFTTIARIAELEKADKSEQEISNIFNMHPFYFKGHLEAKKSFSQVEVYHSLKALLAADVAIKTSSADIKSVFTLLIGEILRPQQLVQKNIMHK